MLICVLIGILTFFFIMVSQSINKTAKSLSVHDSVWLSVGTASIDTYRPILIVGYR